MGLPGLVRVETGFLNPLQFSLGEEGDKQSCIRPLEDP